MQINQRYYQHANLDSHSQFERLNKAPELVNGNPNESIDSERHRDVLHVVEKDAHERGERPILKQIGRDERDGNAEESEYEIGDGQIDNEERRHGFSEAQKDDYEQDERVAADAEYHGNRVENTRQDLQVQRETLILTIVVLQGWRRQ